MTTKATKTGKPAGRVRKGSKLTLSKKTLADLTPSSSKGGAVRGGAARNTNTCGCI